MGTRFTVEGVFRAKDQVTRKLNDMSGGVSRFADQAHRGFLDVSNMTHMLKRGILAVGAAIAAMAAAAVLALRDVVVTGMEFERALAAATAKFPGQIRRGTEEFEALEAAAREVGAATEFTASQAASGLDFLAMAGFDAQQAISALPGVVDLATAAQMDLGRATDIASDSLGAFGLMTTDAAQLGTNLARVNDVLARTSTSANTTIEGMFEAIKMGGPVATAAGASIETFSALVGTLANAGIKGSDAGTALRNAFLRLQAPAADGRRALHRLGVDVADADGNMRDIVDVIGDLNSALAGRGTIERAGLLDSIFGQRGVASAEILMAAGAEQIGEYRAELEGAAGAASEMAGVMRDTAEGDLASMNSAIEEMKLQIFDVVRGPLREIIQGMTEWFRANKDVISSGISDTVAFLTEHSWILVGALGAVVLVALAVAAVIGMIAIGIAVFLAPFLLFWAAVMAVSNALDELSERMDGLGDSIWNWGAGVFDAIASAFDSAADYIGGVLSDIGDFFVGVWDSVASVFTVALEFIVGFFVLMYGYAVQWMEPVFALISDVADWFVEAWTPIGEFFGELWDSITDAFSSAWDWISEGIDVVVGHLRTVWGAVSGFFGELWDGIRDKATEAWSAVVSRVNLVVGEIKAIWKTVATFFSDLWTSIVEGFTAEFSPILATMGRAFDVVRGVGRDAMDGSAEGAQVVTPDERIARSITETTNNARGEVTIRDQTGRAEVTRRPTGPLTLNLARSGA